jgi:hypothetical protein
MMGSGQTSRNQPHLGDVDAELGLLLGALACGVRRRLRHLQLLLQLRHLPRRSHHMSAHVFGQQWPVVTPERAGKEIAACEPQICKLASHRTPVF